MTGIYKITNQKDSVYVGQSRSIERRRSRYSYAAVKDQPRIYNSLKKYGFNNHDFSVIHELPDDVPQDVLNNYEILYMQLYKDCNVDLMNLTEGGSSGKHLEETKAKISLANKGRRNTDNQKRLCGERSKGNKHCVGRVYSEATKKKMSDKKLGLHIGGNNPNAVSIINTETNEIFLCVSDAAKSIGMAPATLGWHIRNPDKNKTLFKRYVFNS